jgi:hypothetical protein
VHAGVYLWLEIAGLLQAAHEGTGFRRRLVHYDGDRHVLGIQRYTVAKQKQQKYGHEKGDGDG